MAVGIKIPIAIEHDVYAAKTYKRNHPESEVIVENIRNIDLNSVEVENPFIVFGGPPCQGFSTSNTKTRTMDNKENSLFKEFVRFVERLAPKWFLFENVEGIVSFNNGEIIDNIKKCFENIGYSTVSEVLNASDYGVPQNRRRIVFVGLKGKRSFEFPEPTHFDWVNGKQKFLGKKKITVWEAIGDLPLLENQMGLEEMPYPSKAKNEYQKLMRKGSKKIYNHVASAHTEQTKKIIALVPPGGNYKMLPERLKKIRNFHVAWTRLPLEMPSPTIDTGHRHHFHPIADRVPTVRESARIQSFPDTFRFLSTKTSQYKQVGNAVPPLLALAIGQQLSKFL